jgi:hypothetical protein
MTKARKQANFRRKVAVLFFIFLFINLVLKFFGISTLDTDEALNNSHAMGIKMSYYVVPAFFLIMGLLFGLLSRRKSAEAESIEIGGCSL